MASFTDSTSSTNTGTDYGAYFKAAGGVFDAIGGVANDLFAIQGAAAEAGQYKQAAELAGENADITKASTAVKVVAQQRDLSRTLGKQQAQLGADGFSTTASGSAFDIMHDSVQQGALAHQMLNLQGAIQYNSYINQENSYLSQEAAAKRAEQGGFMGIIGNVAKGALAIAPLLLL